MNKNRTNNAYHPQSLGKSDFSFLAVKQRKSVRLQIHTGFKFWLFRNRCKESPVPPFSPEGDYDCLPRCSFQTVDLLCSAVGCFELPEDCIKFSFIPP